MKLAKTVIVSGLLFSSVLGSVNVGSITAKATTNYGQSALPVKKDSVKLIYTYKGKELKTKNTNATIDINNRISSSVIKDMDDSNYRIKDGQTFNVFVDKRDNVNSVRVEMEKLKTVSIRYFLDQEHLGDEPIQVSEDAKTVNLDQLKINFAGQSRVVNNQTVFNIDNDGVIRVNLESTVNVSVIYSAEDGTDLSLPIKEVTVATAQDRFNNPSEVPVPAGYELVPGQSLKFVKSGQSRFVRLRVKAVSGQVNNKPSRPGNSNVSVAKPSVKPGNVALQSVHITFKDQNSSELVGYKQLTGKVSSSAKIEAPENYALVNEKDATVNFDKKGNKQVILLVKKMFSAPIMNQGVVTTTNGSYKRLYTVKGKMITNRALGVNSKWYTDQYATVNGEKMYRVATNEWVKASDVK
jgi:hypothetical protein